MALQAWRKQQRIDLYRTIAIVTASVNAEKAQAALQRLIEEMFPEVGNEREDAVDKVMKIMEKEREKTYSVAAVGHSLKKTPWGRAQTILQQKRKPTGR